MAMNEGKVKNTLSPKQRGLENEKSYDNFDINYVLGLFDLRTRSKK